LQEVCASSSGKLFGKWVVPLRVRGAVVDFNLLAVWGHRNGIAAKKTSKHGTGAGGHLENSATIVIPPVEWLAWLVKTVSTVSQVPLSRNRTQIGG
jgi:hypothetical protein